MKSSTRVIFIAMFILGAVNVSAAITHCGVWNESDRLTANVVATTAGDCIIVGANGVQIDCNGFSITYDIFGQGNNSAINITNKLNTNVTNCVIFQGNISTVQQGAANIVTTAINITESNFTNIRNVTFHVNGTSNVGTHYGIVLFNKTI